ncbi:MAG: hypothetical protein JWN31_978 [Frankiales bacterium]|nr:hypothetical protein [Frankiales bacterium]
MDKIRQWIALTVVGALVLAAAGYFLLISPKRSEAADLRTQADAQVSANAALKTQISVLKAQAKALPAKQAQLAAVAAKIPGDPALPALIRDLTVAADDAGVELLSMSPSQPVDVSAPAPTAVTPTSAPVAGGAAAAPAAPAASAAAGTLKQINLALSVTGGYFQVEQFLDQLENLSRALEVKTLSLSPGANPDKPVATGAVVDSPEKTLAASISAVVYMASGRTTSVPVATPSVGK